MNNEPRQNPYEVLGVEKDADARVIKKAYFERVRQTPPETHPEDFRRLREAYELLSDPEARQAFDASAAQQADGPEAEKNAALQEAINLFESGDKVGGRRYLTVLLNEQPDFHDARILLGRHFLYEGDAKEALAEFDALLARAPEHWRGHLQRGWALVRLERMKEAADAFWRAGKHGPSEVAPRVALADCLEAMGQVADALKVLEEAQSLPGISRMDVLALKVRRIATMLEFGQDAAAKKELEQLDAEVPESADAELRRWTGGQLSSAAAHLFSQQKSQGANQLLAFGRRFNPESTTEIAYPTCVSLDIDALPAITREWLDAEAERSNGWRTTSNWGIPAAFSLAFATVTGLMLAHCFLGTEARSAGDWLWCAFFSALFFASTYAVVRYLLRVLASPYGAFNTIHPLHLVMVKIDTVLVWPLVHLQDLRLVNHQTNGVYKHTELEMKFNGLRVVLNVRGQKKAEGVAQELVARRRRVLELLGRGMLDAESGVEHLPAELLARADTHGHVGTERSSSPWLRAAAAACVGVLLVGLSVLPQTRRAEAHVWTRVAAQPGLAAVLTYLRERPGTRFAPQAQARVDAELAQVRERLEARLDPQGAAAPSRVFFTGLLNAMSRAHGRRVTVAWEGGREFRKDDPSERLVTAWQRVMDEALGQGVVLVDGGLEASREGAPVMLLRVRDVLQPSSGSTGAQRVWAVSQEGLGQDVSAPALELFTDAADPRAAEVLFHAWVDRWHLPGAGSRRPLLFTASTLAQESQP